MADERNSDIFVNDDGTLGFVGSQVHFSVPGESEKAAVYVKGSLILLHDITVARPIDRVAPEPLRAKSPSTATFSLAGTGSLATASASGPMKAPPFLVLEALKKDPSAYPLYDTLNALIDAVLQLNRRGG